MKKALSLILALILCLSLCACNQSKNVNDSELQQYAGTWEKEGGVWILHLYNDGVCLVHASGAQMDGANSVHGTWDIRENHIVLRYADGSYDAFEIIGNTLAGYHGTLTKQK